MLACSSRSGRPLSARHVICVHGLWCCFRRRSKATLKRYVASSGENKQPPRFVSPTSRIGPSAPPDAAKLTQIRHSTLGKSKGREGRGRLKSARMFCRCKTIEAQLRRKQTNVWLVTSQINTAVFTQDISVAVKRTESHKTDEPHQTKYKVHVPLRMVPTLPIRGPAYVHGTSMHGMPIYGFKSVMMTVTWNQDR